MNPPGLAAARGFTCIHLYVNTYVREYMHREAQRERDTDTHVHRRHMLVEYEYRACGSLIPAYRMPKGPLHTLTQIPTRTYAAEGRTDGNAAERISC